MSIIEQINSLVAAVTFVGSSAYVASVFTDVFRDTIQARRISAFVACTGSALSVPLHVFTAHPMLATISAVSAAMYGWLFYRAETQRHAD